MCIFSFDCADTQKFYETGKHPKFTNIKSPLARKLNILDAATSLNDLASLPGNCLHPLTKEKDLNGCHAIKINDQFRLCFMWTLNGPEKVKVIDYH